VVDQLARTVPVGHAVAACDEGAWALVDAIASKLDTPAVLVRRTPKTYFVSYGDDPAIGDGRLAGERLQPRTPIHLIDDLVFSGRTLRSAREALNGCTIWSASRWPPTCGGGRPPGMPAGGAAPAST